MPRRPPRAAVRRSCRDVGERHAHAGGEDTRRPWMVTGWRSTDTMRSARPMTVGGVVDVGQQHGELVAAEARHGVARAHDRASALAGDDEQLVAGLVTHAVVDALNPSRSQKHSATVPGRRRRWRGRARRGRAAARGWPARSARRGRLGGAGRPPALVVRPTRRAAIPPGRRVRPSGCAGAENISAERRAASAASPIEMLASTPTSTRTCATVQASSSTGAISAATATSGSQSCRIGRSVGAGRGSATLGCTAAAAIRT